jgi:hypothetical protein
LAIERFGGSKGISFLLLLGLGYLLFWGVAKLGNRLIGSLSDGGDARNSLMVPILLPLAFSGELVYRLKYLLVEAGRFPAVFGHQFGFDLERFSFTVSALSIEALSVFVMVLGGLGSLYAIRLVGEKAMPGRSMGVPYRTVQALVGSVFLGYLVLNF